jgi:hypothetical protein
MTPPTCLVLPLIVLCGFAGAVYGQTVAYAGAITGVATISADAGAQAMRAGLALSSYSPQNGAALNLFGGAHLDNYFSVQANYIVNHNDLVLSSAASGSGVFYQEARNSSQQAFIGDFLVYFRKRSSRIRPYLGTGTGVVHLTSSAEMILSSGGTPALPPPTFSSNRPVLRSHVGIDVRLSRQFDFRYSFSETIAKNDISRHLSPPAPRRLATFQNLFGFVVRF